MKILGIVAGCREDADYKTAKPLLDAIAHRVMWMGHAGAGQKAKVALTLQRCATLVGAVEAQVALANVGSDVNVMVEDVIDFMHDMNSFLLSRKLSLRLCSMKSTMHRLLSSI